MDNIDVFNDVIRIFFINVFIYAIYIKIIDYKNYNFRKNIIMIIWSFFTAILYVILSKIANSFGTIIIVYFIYGCIIKYLINENKNFNPIPYIISFMISYITYLISTVLSGIILRGLVPSINYKSPISLITIPLITFVLLRSILRMKRFKNGFNFIKNSKINKKIEILTILFLRNDIINFWIVSENEYNYYEYIYFYRNCINCN